jgi:hypothetical protein
MANLAGTSTRMTVVQSGLRTSCTHCGTEGDDTNPTRQRGFRQKCPSLARRVGVLRVPPERKPLQDDRTS